MDVHALHAERIRHQAGVLAAGAAKAGQGVLGDVVATLHADVLDRVGHVFNSDTQKARGDLLGRLLLPGRALDGQRQRLELVDHRAHVQRLIAVRTKYRREQFGTKFADHHIAIRDRQRAAASVSGWARVGTGTLRPNAKFAAVKRADRATTGRHGVYLHDRCAQTHTRDLGLKGALVFAGKVRHVGRCATHVEADHLVEAGELSHRCGANDAARRAGQDCVLALKLVRVGQAARALHELQAHIAQRGLHLLDISTQDR